jgi:hypothetical protein
MRGCRKLKEETLDRNVWGTRFGRDYGSVIRHCGMNETLARSWVEKRQMFVLAWNRTPLTPLFSPSSGNYTEGAKKKQCRCVKRMEERLRDSEGDGKN